MRTIQYIKEWLMDGIARSVTFVLMKMKLVKVGSGLRSSGIPRMFVHRHGTFLIGKNFTINNTIASNPIGRNFQCIFKVDRNAFLQIGDNVGMSGTTIVCLKEVVILNNVKIGGNTCIYDTDFHSLNAEDRNKKVEDLGKVKKKRVFIGKNVFIGAHVTILKGVNIGENSIIGACSVVSKDIPANEIWAGNPAKYIRKIDEN